MLNMNLRSGHTNLTEEQAFNMLYQLRTMLLLICRVPMGKEINQDKYGPIMSTEICLFQLGKHANSLPSQG